MDAEPEFHVLAVDDNLIDRKLIEKLLKTSSYHVTTVDSGIKALEFLGFCGHGKSNPNPLSFSTDNTQEMEVNLVITDYCMPGMTGYDLLKKIKGTSSLRNIPVVIMSSENDPSRINRCLEEGAEEFLLKPVKLADVNKLKPHMMKRKCKDQMHAIPEQQTEKKQPQPQPQQTLDNNKRKAMEGGLSPDRTRHRYSGLTMV